MVRYGRKYIHEWVYAAGLMLLAIALPSSVFLMSVAQLILFFNWVAEGQFGLKLNRIRYHKTLLVFISIYLVHVLGMLYSSDMTDGLSTLRSRLPILLLTIVVASSNSMSYSRWRMILLVFSAAVTFVSLISLHTWITGNYTDYRELSPFISHIRMSLMVAMSVCLLVWFGIRDKTPGFFLLAGWHLFYLYMLHSLTGMIAIGVVAVYFGVPAMARLRTAVKITAFALVIVMMTGLIIMAFFVWRNITLELESDLSHLDSLTSKGAPYLHDKQVTHRENGYLVYIYIAEDELREAWTEVSDLDFDGQVHSGEALRLVLYRYMTSKGLRKDAEGLRSLTHEDVTAVEKGITNVLYCQWPWILTRLHQTLWELHMYANDRDPAGHTLAQRLEFWRAAVAAIKKSPWTGWGTGDLRKASAYGLEAIESPLTFERWMKPHNQYLSFVLKFGIVGGFWVIFAMLFPLRGQKTHSSGLFIAFLIILFVSMLNEDTLDTQPGLSFFVFFYNMLLFMQLNNNSIHERKVD